MDLIVGTSTLPHNLKNSDVLEFYNSSPSLSELDGKSQIAITSFKTSLSVGIGNTIQTGMTTSLVVNNNVFDIVKRERLQVNDYLGINDEKVKILGFNSENNALIVERGQLSTIGAGITHVAGSDIILDSRQILFSKNIRNNRNIVRSRQFYFNPPEVVGLGVVGISTFNSYIGSGSTIALRQIKIQSIYIKDHKFNTGDELIYSSSGESSIKVTRDIIPNEFSLEDESTVYAVNLGKDYVVLSTSSIAIGSDGNYIGVGTNTIPTLLYFTKFGSGSVHSLRTPESIDKSNVKKYVGIVTTKDHHDLLDKDKVTIDINSSLSEKVYEVEYNSTLRKSIFNPRFATSIDTETNIITLENHGYNTGDRIFYESSNPSSPLVDETIYYVHRLSRDTFKLTVFEWDSHSVIQ